MLLKYTAFLIIAFLINACEIKSGMEESVVIYDTGKNELFLTLLEEKNIHYRIQEGGVIYYPVEQKEIVKEIFEDVMGKKIPDLSPTDPPQ